MKQLLKVKNLKVSFVTKGGLTHAVRDLGFELFEGETLGIVGESGCGKSVTAKALLQLHPPSSVQIEGEAWFGGQNLLGLPEEEMQKIRGKEIGMVFQDPMTSLNPTLKIGFQIVEGFLRHHPHVSRRQAMQEAIEMLKLVGIPHPEERIDEYPHTLSGGMRQRVMIALALMSKPKLLIADEPTTALDVTIQAQILHLIKTIQTKTQTSVILITHDLSVVAGSCDRVLVMYAGKIVESAPVEELFARPKHPYTQRLLLSKPRLDMPQDSPLVSIDGTPPSLKMLPPGCGFCDRCHVAMNICAAHSPPFFTIKDTHESACWMHDSRAVKEKS